MVFFILCVHHGVFYTMGRKVWALLFDTMSFDSFCAVEARIGGSGQRALFEHVRVVFVLVSKH